MEELGQQECPKVLLFIVEFDLSYRRAAYYSSEEFGCLSLQSRASVVSHGRGWGYLQACGQRCWWFLETNSAVLVGLVASKGISSGKGLLLVVFR